MRTRLALLATAALLAAGLGVLLLMMRVAAAPDADQPIVIGQLQDLSGPLRASEAPLVAAARLAVEEINAAGGLLGRRVELVVMDTQAQAGTAAAAAETLITQRRAAALFGCWATRCRDAVRPVVERHRHLLFYPAAYEGMEQSPHIVYAGATPNQLSLPATDWALQRFGRRVYLLGTDGPFAHRVHALLSDFIRLQGGEIVGEHYVPLGSTSVGDVVAAVRERRPDFVLSTLAGSSNAALFEQLVGAGMADQALLSLGLGEPEMKAARGGRLSRHFTAAGYLQSLPGPANADFRARLRQSQGEAGEAGDAAVSMYTAVRLWAAAVRELGSPQTDAVNANVLLQTVDGPQGFAAVDAQSRHLWRQLRVAQVRPDGSLAEVMALPRYIRPAPWPTFRSVEYWQAAMPAREAGP